MTKGETLLLVHTESALQDAYILWWFPKDRVGNLQADLGGSQGETSTFSPFPLPYSIACFLICVFFSCGTPKIKIPSKNRGYRVWWGGLSSLLFHTSCRHTSVMLCFREGWLAMKNIWQLSPCPSQTTGFHEFCTPCPQLLVALYSIDDWRFELAKRIVSFLLISYCQ